MHGFKAGLDLVVKKDTAMPKLLYFSSVRNMRNNNFDHRMSWQYILEDVEALYC